MPDSSLLQMALDALRQAGQTKIPGTDFLVGPAQAIDSVYNGTFDLLNRPGNAARSGLAHGPEAIIPGLLGEIRTAGTELPGMDQISDKPFLDFLPGLNPRSIAGFGAEALVDPTNLIPGKAGTSVSGHVAEHGATSPLIRTAEHMAPGATSELSAAMAQRGGVVAEKAMSPEEWSALQELFPDMGGPVMVNPALSGRPPRSGTSPDLPAGTRMSPTSHLDGGANEPGIVPGRRPGSEPLSDTPTEPYAEDVLKYQRALQKPIDSIDPGTVERNPGSAYNRKVQAAKDASAFGGPELLSDIFGPRSKALGARGAELDDVLEGVGAGNLRVSEHEEPLAHPYSTDGGSPAEQAAAKRWLKQHENALSQPPSGLDRSPWDGEPASLLDEIEAQINQLVGEGAGTGHLSRFEDNTNGQLTQGLRNEDTIAWLEDMVRQYLDRKPALDHKATEIASDVDMANTNARFAKRDAVKQRLDDNWGQQGENAAIWQWLYGYSGRLKEGAGKTGVSGKQGVANHVFTDNSRPYQDGSRKFGGGTGSLMDRLKDGRIKLKGLGDVRRFFDENGDVLPGHAGRALTDAIMDYYRSHPDFGGPEKIEEALGKFRKRQVSDDAKHLLRGDQSMYGLRGKKAAIEDENNPALDGGGEVNALMKGGVTRDSEYAKRYGAGKTPAEREDLLARQEAEAQAGRREYRHNLEDGEQAGSILSESGDTNITRLARELGLNLSDESIDPQDLARELLRTESSTRLREGHTGEPVGLSGPYRKGEHEYSRPVVSNAEFGEVTDKGLRGSRFPSQVVQHTSTRPEFPDLEALVQALKPNKGESAGLTEEQLAEFSGLSPFLDRAMRLADFLRQGLSLSEAQQLLRSLPQF